MASMAYLSQPKNPIKSWAELVARETDFGGPDEWAFRGQKCPDFPATSLERHGKELGLLPAAVMDLEVKLIRDFARRYHLYGGLTPPAQGRTLEWLSLLRHYGTPTRLVDFTYSFFVAVYFALEAADASSVVWAINVTRLDQEAAALIGAKLPDGRDRLNNYVRERDAASFRALFMDQPPLRFVRSANPIRLNERLTVQQGLFLAPGDVTATFEENVRALRDHAKYVVKIAIDPSCRTDVLRRLHRLGINAATLFPGLEGFARSLRTKSLILTELPPQETKLLEQV